MNRSGKGSFEAISKRDDRRNSDRVDWGLRSAKGFTLTEIIVVIFIIGFLIGSVAMVVGRTQERGAVIATLSEMDNMKKAIRERLYLDLGLIPEDEGAPNTPQGISVSRTMAPETPNTKRCGVLWGATASWRGTDIQSAAGGVRIWSRIHGTITSSTTSGTL